MTSLRAQRKPMLIHEVSREFSESDDMQVGGDGRDPGWDKSKNDGHVMGIFATPPMARSADSGPGRISRFFHKTINEKTPGDIMSAGHKSSPSIFAWNGNNSFHMSEDGSDGGASLSNLFQSSHQPSESASAAGPLSHITSILHSSMSTLKRGFDAQGSGSVANSFSSDEEVGESFM